MLLFCYHPLKSRLPVQPVQAGSEKSDASSLALAAIANKHRLLYGCDPAAG